MSLEPLNLPATDPFDRHAKEHPFVASVVSSGWVLFRTHAPLLLLFGVPLVAIQTDAVWFNFPLGKGATIPGPWERSVMSYIFVALFGMCLVEALLNTIRLALDPGRLHGDLPTENDLFHVVIIPTGVEPLIFDSALGRLFLFEQA